MTVNISSGNTVAQITGSVSTQALIPIADGTNQVVEQAFIVVGTSATQHQVATPDATWDIYFLGVRHTGNATGANTQIFDAASGAAPGTSAGIMYAFGNAACFLYFQAPMSAVNEDYIAPAPIKVTNGIRVQTGAAGSGGYIEVVYLKVRK